MSLVGVGAPSAVVPPGHGDLPSLARVKSLPGAPQALISPSAHAPRCHLCSQSLRVDGTICDDICDDALQKIVRVAPDDVGQVRALSRMRRQHEPPTAAALLAREKASIGRRRSCRVSFEYSICARDIQSARKAISSGDAMRKPWRASNVTHNSAASRSESGVPVSSHA